MAITGKGQQLEGWSFAALQFMGSPITFPRRMLDFGDQDAADGTVWADWYFPSAGGTTISGDGAAVGVATGNAIGRAAWAAIAASAGLATVSGVGDTAPAIVSGVAESSGLSEAVGYGGDGGWHSSWARSGATLMASGRCIFIHRILAS